MNCFYCDRIEASDPTSERLRSWLGAMPASGGEVRPLEVARREYQSHTEIKLTYEGEPGERIPAYLLLPRHAPAGRLPAVFAAHQCAWLCDVGKEQVVGHCVDLPDQAYGLELVREAGQADDAVLPACPGQARLASWR